MHDHHHVCCPPVVYFLKQKRRNISGNLDNNMSSWHGQRGTGSKVQVAFVVVAKTVISFLDCLLSSIYLPSTWIKCTYQTRRTSRTSTRRWWRRRSSTRNWKMINNSAVKINSWKLEEIEYKSFSPSPLLLYACPCHHALCHRHSPNLFCAYALGKLILNSSAPIACLSSNSVCVLWCPYCGINGWQKIRTDAKILSLSTPARALPHFPAVEWRVSNMKSSSNITPLLSKLLPIHSLCCISVTRRMHPLRSIYPPTKRDRVGTGGCLPPNSEHWWWWDGAWLVLDKVSCHINIQSRRSAHQNIPLMLMSSWTSAHEMCPRLSFFCTTTTTRTTSNTSVVVGSINSDHDKTQNKVASGGGRKSIAAI